MASWICCSPLEASPAGFSCRELTGHKTIHTLYTPKSRKNDFPEADWKFLIRSATNVARAVAIVHEHGCVIGDINHGSILVSPKATVKLINCESFQVVAQGRASTYGKLAYQPTHLLNFKADHLIKWSELIIMMPSV